MPGTWPIYSEMICFRYEWDTDRQSHYDFLGNWHNVTSHLAIHIFLRFIRMIKIPTLAMQLKTICYHGLWLLYHLNVAKVQVAATTRGGSCLCTSISISFFLKNAKKSRNHKKSCFSHQVSQKPEDNQTQKKSPDGGENWWLSMVECVETKHQLTKSKIVEPKP